MLLEILLESWNHDQICGWHFEGYRMWWKNFSMLPPIFTYYYLWMIQMWGWQFEGYRMWSKSENFWQSSHEGSCCCLHHLSPLLELVKRELHHFHFNYDLDQNCLLPSLDGWVKCLSFIIAIIIHENFIAPAIIALGTLSKKNYGIIWEFFPYGGGVFPIPKTFVNWPSVFLHAKFILRC